MDVCEGDRARSNGDVMADNERTLLIALVLMVRQYLDEYDDEVDSRSISAGEHAIEALAAFGLMEVVNTRFGRWTDAGKKLLTEIGCGISEPIDHPGQIRLVGTSEPEN